MATFGCNAFALLFDDIDPELSETDKSVFHSSAGAQVSVTNEVYEHLGQPVFYFCPTGMSFIERKNEKCFQQNQIILFL